MWESEIKPFFQQNTKISTAALDQLGQLIKNREASSNLVNASQEISIYHLLEIEYDFLLSCIACYEVAYINHRYADGDHTKWLISRMFEAYSQPNNEKSCFRCLMDSLIEWLGGYGLEVSQGQLASCVPLNGYVNTKGEDKLLAQRNKLGKWYKGDDLPPSSALKEFISSFFKSIEEPWNVTVYDAAKIAIGVDKAFKKYNEALKAEFGGHTEVFPNWKKAMGNYETYFDHYSELYSK